MDAQLEPRATRKPDQGTAKTDAISLPKATTTTNNQDIEDTDNSSVGGDVAVGPKFRSVSMKGICRISETLQATRSCHSENCLHFEKKESTGAQTESSRVNCAITHYNITTPLPN